MKLLVDARIGWGHGIGRVNANTIPRIAKLHPAWQIDVLIAAKDLPMARMAFVGVSNLHIIECSIEPFSLSEQVGLERHARGYDLTWFTNYWVPLGWRTPFVVTVHDMLHLLPRLLPASMPKRLLARQTFAKVRRDARAVMFVSRFTQSAFTHMIGAPQAAVTVQLGGDHLDYGVPRPVRMRSRRLLVVAAAKQHKNFELLFDAWNAAAVPDHWVLSIITPKSMMRSSIDLGAALGSKGRIDIQRGISDKALAALYADSAILLMPSLYEGFGLPLLEGMLAGALCVSSNAGAMVEVAEGALVEWVNGSDRIGWTSAIEQACAMVDGDDLDLDAILQHNIGCARRFQWEKTAAEVAEVIVRAAA